MIQLTLLAKVCQVASACLQSVAEPNSGLVLLAACLYAVAYSGTACAIAVAAWHRLLLLAFGRIAGLFNPFARGIWT